MVHMDRPGCYASCTVRFMVSGRPAALRFACVDQMHIHSVANGSSQAPFRHGKMYGML